MSHAQIANIAIAAKTVQPHERLEGTIYSAAAAIERAGGKAMPLQVDIRNEAAIADALAHVAKRFGGIDIVVNNASAISLTKTPETDVKRFDLMQSVNARATFVTAKHAVPYLLASANPHVLTLSPPLNMNPKWFGAHVGYTMAKYGMSMVTLGMAHEFSGRIAFNSLWPQTTIATAAVRNLLGGEAMIRRSRQPAIVADAAHVILSKPAALYSGNFCVDEAVLREAGQTDFDAYAVDKGAGQLEKDLFLD